MTTGTTSVCVVDGAFGMPDMFVKTASPWGPPIGLPWSTCPPAAPKYAHVTCAARLYEGPNCKLGAPHPGRKHTSSWLDDDGYIVSLWWGDRRTAMVWSNSDSEWVDA